jgi:flagellar hook protein FlgE
MIGSLYSGISGLKANTSAMSVIGDNIANVGTTGFKASQVSFSNVFNASMGQSDMQIGRGVTMSGTSANWNSGTVETTNNVTDLAINGQGMFIVQDPADGAEYYTRAGQFEFDVDGYLSTADGLRVQGNTLNPLGVSMGLGDIILPPTLNDPAFTTEIELGINLDAGASPAIVGPPAVPADTYDTTMTVYDSLGNGVELNFTFTRMAVALGSQWDYVVAPSLGTLTVGAGTLDFDSSGVLTTAGPENIQVALAAATGAADLNVNWLLTSDMTGYATNSVKTSQTQDGYASGMLQGISVDEDGIFTGLYSNGQNQPFAQVMLADFAAYSGLSKQGSNLFMSTLASGSAIQLLPNEAGAGGIAPSSLEMSNVDLATEFVELITTQRAFQANSKVITTSDEILSDLINIKR